MGPVPRKRLSLLETRPYLRIDAGCHGKLHPERRLRPKTSGTLTASITITDNADNSPQAIAVSGTGVASPVVKFSSGSRTFPSTDVDATSASQTVTLTNTGDATLAVKYIISKGANASSFLGPSNLRNLRHCRSKLHHHDRLPSGSGRLSY